MSETFTVLDVIFRPEDERTYSYRADDGKYLEGELVAVPVGKDKYKDAFVFKGGTSLSKAYHVIERFSEDIDIILDWRKIVPIDDNPWNDRSKTKQDQYNKLVNARAF